MIRKCTLMKAWSILSTCCRHSWSPRRQAWGRRRWGSTLISQRIQQVLFNSLSHLDSTNNSNNSSKRLAKRRSSLNYQNNRKSSSQILCQYRRNQISTFCWTQQESFKLDKRIRRRCFVNWLTIIWSSLRRRLLQLMETLHPISKFSTSAQSWAKSLVFSSKATNQW